MKKTFLIILLAFAVSCNSNTVSRNDKMTSFLNQKKILEDSLLYYRGSEAMFKDSSHEVAHSTDDSTKYLPLGDSEVKYWNAGRLTEGKLKELAFSIDSLSKMK